MIRTPPNRLLEICVDSLDGVRAAIAGGADRIELCAALDVGGLTPSAGLVEAARIACSAAGVTLFAMVRPRAGDFTYDPGDLALAVADARALVTQGIDGLVFGAVRDGLVDEAVAGAWLSTVRDAAGMRLPATFHRAIDVVESPVAAVTAVAGLGFDTILTSGGERTAPAGAATIRAMVERAAATSLTIMAGSGVTADNAGALIAATGVQALHASAGTAGPAPAPRLVEMGFVSASPRRTDHTVVAKLRSTLDNRDHFAH